LNKVWRGPTFRQVEASQELTKRTTKTKKCDGAFWTDDDGQLTFYGGMLFWPERINDGGAILFLVSLARRRILLMLEALIFTENGEGGAAIIEEWTLCMGDRWDDCENAAIQWDRSADACVISRAGFAAERDRERQDLATKPCKRAPACWKTRCGPTCQVAKVRGGRVRRRGGAIGRWAFSMSRRKNQRVRNVQKRPT
jgi:hypothetical protein